MPSISVIIPAFSKQKILDMVLLTLKNQEISKASGITWECIVVDDGSSPPLQVPKWVQLLRIEREMIHRGSSSAKNYGASKAVGHYLIFSDAEILHMPNALESLTAAYLDWNREDVLLNVMRCELKNMPSFKDIENMTKFLYELRRAGGTDGRHENLNIPVVTYEQNCGMVTRKFFEQVGGYDEEGFPSWGFNNHDLCLRVAQAGGRVSSHIPQLGTKRRLLCFHVPHDAPTGEEAKTQAAREFSRKWGREWHGEMLREIENERVSV